MNVSRALVILALFCPSATAQKPAEAVFSFGVVADVQYADQPDSGKRHYKSSLGRLEKCVSDLNRRDLSFVVQLGDFIDKGKDSFDAVLPLWRGLRAPRKNVIGNHDLPFLRERTLDVLGLKNGYYDFEVKGWRFVVIDGMDVSLHGYPRGHAKRKEATKMLAALRDKGVKNAQTWNGGVGKDQLAWLRSTLADATKKGQQVVLNCHFPILLEASSEHHLLWNHAEVLELIEGFPCVTAWFNGHDHGGGYAAHNGIHHVTFAGMVEAPKKNAYSVVEVRADKLVVQGIGKQKNLELALPKRPNILWISCEDISPHVGCYGDSYAVTPNIDALAKQGVLYENAFATIGVCAPARSTIITGMYPPSIGSQHMRCTGRLPKGVRCFPELLRKAGYYCTNNSKTDYNLRAPKKTWDRSNRTAHWRGRKAGQPFFAVFNLTVCHESKIRMPEKQYASRTRDFTAAERHDPEKAVPPPYHPNTSEVRRDWARYADVITLMDKQVARILRELKEDGLEEDTVVIFFSDHGAGMPRSKRWLYDSSLRVPMIARFPEKYRALSPDKAGKPGTRTDRLVSFVDLAPTVLSLAGVSIPAYMQGKAFLGAKAAPPRQRVYGFRGRMDERYDMIRCVRDKRFKYIRNFMPHRVYAQYLDYMYQMPTMRVWQRMYDDGKLSEEQKAFFEPKPFEELYDTKADPHEIKNLAGDAKHKATLERMRGQLETWMFDIRDLGLLPEAEMRSRFGDVSQYDAVRARPDSYPFERIMLAAEIANRRDVAELPRVIKRLRAKEPAVRYWAAVACAALGEKAAPAKAPLVKALSDGSPDVRIAAAEALCGLNAMDVALPVLRAALADKSEWARLRAINVIDRLDKRATDLKPEIRAATKDKNKYVVRVAQKTLVDLR